MQEGHQLFSEFDNLVARYGLEKIKTIGDAYMIAGGIPVAREDHCEVIARCALEIQKIMNEKQIPELEGLEVRIGINTGPVVAGVIGKSKFIYDLWGDSVNTASRMESHGTPGKIHVTEEVYFRLKKNFIFEGPRTIDVKGKGEMQTYFLIREKQV